MKKIPEEHIILFCHTVQVQVTLVLYLLFSPHSYGDIGYFANIYAGIRINKNNMFKIRYFHYDNNGLSTKYGLSTESTSSFITDKDDKYDAIILQWYYDF